MRSSPVLALALLLPVVACESRVHFESQPMAPRTSAGGPGGTVGSDAYYDMAFPDLALAPPDARLHTHVCVVGTVASKRRERDGDSHVKLCQGDLCLILEAIPEAPIELPRKGQRIRACGIQRWDGWHRWQEIHPFVKWEERP